MRVIETQEDIAEGVAHLCAVEPRFAAAVAAGADPPLRRRAGGFGGLVAIIVSQQVSVASGNAIFARVADAGRAEPAALLAASDEALRGLGLSRPKIRALRAAAEAARDGRLCFTRQRALAVDAAMAEMTAITGIGPWTAEIYQMFAVGRADVFAPKDLALQEAARALFGLAARPSPTALSEMAEPWSPWRAVAARTLWAYYRVIKGRSGQALDGAETAVRSGEAS